MLKKHLLTTAGLVTIFAFAATGCSSSDGGGDGNGELEFWSFTGIGQKDDVDKYLADHPDAKIKLTEVGSSQETAQALTTALAGGKVPDLVLIQGEDMPKFVENAHNFVDLNTLGAGDIEDDYVPWIYGQATSRDGETIGIPTDAGGLAMAYRADLFEAAGLPSEPDDVTAAWSTWDDFIEFGEEYVAATGKPFLDNVSTSVFFATVNQVSEQYYSPDGEVVFDTNPQVKEAFDVAVKAYEAGIGAELPAFSSGWTAGKGKGDYAAMTAPSWMLSSFKNDAPNTEGKWRVVAVPGVAGNWGGSYLAIPKRAENPKAAWEYIKAMQSPEAQLAKFNEAGSLPTTVSSLAAPDMQEYTDDFFGDSKIGAVMSDSITQFQPFWTGPDVGAIGTGLMNALMTMEDGGITPDKAWDTALSNVNQALGK